MYRVRRRKVIARATRLRLSKGLSTSRTRLAKTKREQRTTEPDFKTSTKQEQEEGQTEPSKKHKTETELHAC